MSQKRTSLESHRDSFDLLCEKSVGIGYSLGCSNSQTLERLRCVDSICCFNEETSFIKSLPYDFDADRHRKRTDVIARINDRRKTRHEYAVNEMLKNMTKVNEETENAIREKSTEFKRALHEKWCEFTAGFVQTFEMDDEQLLKLNIDVFKEMETRMTSFKNESEIFIEDFIGSLHDLEKQRSSDYKPIMKQCYETLHTIYFLLPNEIQQFLEQKILEYNQCILNNTRCYEELREQLLNVLINDLYLQKQKLQMYKDRWKNVLLEDACKKIGKCKLDILKQGTDTLDELYQFEDDFTNTLSNQSFDKETFDIQEWKNKIQCTVYGLEKYASKLINLYKKAVKSIFHGYLDILKTLSISFCEEEFMDKENSQGKNIFQSEIFSDNNIIVFNIKEIVESFQEKMFENVKSICRFLDATAHLWDPHFDRVATAKDVINKQIEHINNEHDTKNLTKEVKLNLLVDQLREAPNEYKLSDKFYEVEDYFDGLEKFYEMQNEIEKETVQNYLKLSKQDIEVLLAELKWFLNEFPNDEDVDPTISRIRESQMDLIFDETEIFIPKEMKKCSFQINAVRNWMFGLREAIKDYYGKCEKIMMDEAYALIESMLSMVSLRFESKLARNNERLERVRKDVYEIRLTELKLHSERFQRHQMGVEKYLNEISLPGSGYEEKVKNCCDDFSNKLSDIIQAVEGTKTSKSVLEIENRLHMLRKMKQNELKNLEHAQIQHSDATVALIIDSGKRFLEHIRLFSEDGNFHEQEAKTFMKELLSIEKHVQKQKNVSKKNVQKVTHQGLKTLANKFAHCNDKIKSWLEKFTFEEDILERIKSAQLAIKKEVYNLKLKAKTLDGAIKEMKSDLEKRNGKAECIDTVCYIVKNAAEEMHDFSGNLSSEKSSVSPSSAEDYLYYLFNFTLLHQETFLAKINEILKDSATLIQSCASNFFEKNRKVELKTLPSSFSQLMQDVVAKFKYYYIQSEVVWLKQANELITTYKGFIEYVKSYFKNFVSEFHKQTKEKLENKSSFYADKCTTIINKHNSDCKSIYKQLDTKHGRPEYANELDVLDQQMQAQLENMTRLQFSEDFSNFKEFVNYDVINYFSKIYYLVDKFTEVLEMIDNNSSILILKQCHNTTFNDISCSIIPSENPSQTNITAIEEDILKTYRKYLKNIHLPKILTLISEETPSSEINETPILDINIEPFITDFTSFYKSEIEKYENSFREFKTTIDKWQDIWKNDVKRVKHLYIVQNDIIGSEKVYR